MPSEFGDIGHISFSDMRYFFKIRVPTVREKSVKNEKNSRSGKSQGILSWVREI